MVIQVDSLWGVVVIVMILTWFLFAAIFAFRKKPPKSASVKAENRSRFGIIVQMSSFALLWAVPQRVSGPPFPMPPTIEILLAALTMVIGPASCLLSLSAVRTLGKQWAYIARVVEGHELVTSGPYNLVRNPIYLGMFGMFLMTGLAWTRWWAMLIGLVVFLSGTAIRIHSEEKLLRASFGVQFEEYARRVPAFIPWLI